MNIHKIQLKAFGLAVGMMNLCALGVIIIEVIL
jgi:hypothetical protein